jgi:hypothetical protein
MNGGSVEIGNGRNAAPIGEREAVREGFHGAGHAIAARAAQLGEIVERGKGDDQTPVVAQDAPEFVRVSARGDGEDNGKRAAGIGHEAIGIGHDPFASGETARGSIHSGNRNVDAVRIAAGPERPSSKGVVTPRSCNRRREATAAGVSPGRLDRFCCGWSRLMYPLRATSKAWPRGQSARRSSRTSAR